MALSESSGRSPGPNLDQYQRHYLKLFVNRTEPVMRATRGKWFCDRSRLNRHELEWAINGQLCLGIYAVSNKGTSKWLCLDADTKEHLTGLSSIAATMADQDNVLLERSQRGGHLWIFCPPTPWEEVANYGHYLTLAYGLKDIEIFPKSGGLNGVKAPATRHPKTGLVYPFVNIATGELLVDHRDVILALRPRALPRVFYKEDVQHGPEAIRHGVQHGQPDVRGHADLVQAVSAYTTLKKTGHPEERRYSGLCPFHNDHHPSFGISDRVWQCWTCKIGGYLSDFERLVKERGL